MSHQFPVRVAVIILVRLISLKIGSYFYGFAGMGLNKEPYCPFSLRGDQITLAGNSQGLFFFFPVAYLPKSETVHFVEFLGFSIPVRVFHLTPKIRCLGEP